LLQAGTDSRAIAVVQGGVGATIWHSCMEGAHDKRTEDMSVAYEDGRREARRGTI